VLLVASDPRFFEHIAGRSHPERPARLGAVLEALGAPDVRDAVVPLEPRAATRTELERVHTAEYLDWLEAFCAQGGGKIDLDTGASAASWDAARYAAGAGLEAVEALQRGDGEAAFCALRPPGHHALATRGMGFCLLNNVAVAAAHLRDRGERVLIVDWDAHHGNGTEAIFWTDPNVCYVSLHEYPQYPGTGAARDIGESAGEGTTVNVPLPAGATGDVYLEALDTLVAPIAEKFDPAWVLVSAGFDAHRADPLTSLGLSSGDFVDLTVRVQAMGPPRRMVLFLEGGYDLDALRDSTTATVTTLLGGAMRPEPTTAGGPGHLAVATARDLRLDQIGG
jgi:acetoin utilization deacetylase AcuC-like enzyme